MKKTLALFLALVMTLSLCACNSSDADPIKGTWSMDISAREFLIFYKEQLNEFLGIGDISNLIQNPPVSQDLTFLLVFDGEGIATAYLEISSLQNFLSNFFQNLLSEQTLYQLFGSQEQAQAAMGGLSIQDLLYILHTQFSSMHFAQDFAQLCGYSYTEEYLIIPIDDSYRFQNSLVFIGDSFLEYSEADLKLTESAKLNALGFHLADKPFVFHRLSDRTEY